MRPPFSTRLGKLLQNLREQAGMRQDELAIHLNVSVSTIQDWEEGRSEPPDDLEFYARLQDVPGFTYSDIVVPDLYKPGPKSIIVRIGFKGESGAILERRIRELEEADRNPPRSFTEMGHHAMMPEPDLSLLADLASNLVQPEAQPVRIHYPHTMPDHGSDIVAEGKRQQAPNKGEVYKRPRSHYDSDYLRENARHIVSILGDALENDDPVLSPDRKQALHVVVESIVKKKGASLNKVSHEKHIPHPSLADWVRKGLVPVLYRDKRTIYLANEIAEEVSHDYQDAKEMNYSAARLLRERREKYFPVEAAQSRT